MKVKAFGQDHETVAFGYYEMAELAAMSNNSQLETEYTDKGNTCVINWSGQKHIKIGKHFINLAKRYSDKAKYILAVERYEAAQTIFLLHYPNNHPAIANIVYQIGIVYGLLKNEDKNISYCQEANRLLREALYSVYHKQAVKVLSKHKLLSIEEEAILKSSEDETDNFYKPFHIKNPNLAIIETQPEFSFSEQESLAKKYYDEGIVFFKTSDYANAMSHLELALEAFINLYGRYHVLISSTYFLLAKISFNQNKYDEAVQAYENCVETDRGLYLFPTTTTELMSRSTMFIFFLGKCSRVFY